jgi:hypothetical protein
MKELVSVLRAANLAAQWHVHQRRKGAAGEPYINHLLEVSNLATQATSGIDPNVTIAALLHDAIEDQDVTAETIASEFGQHIASIVLEVTDDKSLPKAERKRLQIETAPHKSRGSEAGQISRQDQQRPCHCEQSCTRLDGTAQGGIRAVGQRRSGWITRNVAVVGTAIR